jgi:hypothetical protein
MALKQQSLALKGIAERIEAINNAAGKQVASFEIAEVTGAATGTVATLMLPLVLAAERG